MEITDAAQAVQRSGFPDAYADHEDDARAIACALIGQLARARFGCDVAGDVDEADPTARRHGLDRARRRVVRQLTWRRFGDLSARRLRARRVSSGHMEGSAHYEGRAIDVFLRPVSAENKRRGLGGGALPRRQRRPARHQHVIFDDRIWTAGSARATAGATTTRADVVRRRPAILEHRDHVHVDVVD